jgi:dTDP-4-amino-4,6-dideoxygalactose transaminase
VIPCASPLAQYRAHQKQVDTAIARVLESGQYILGEEVENFEHAFAGYCGVTHAVGVASGTDALTLALRGFGIGAGDEVITVSHTALATIAAILACGATPVLVDVEEATYTIDPARIEAAITARSKAIIAVHLYGQPADLDRISTLARRYRLAVVEDCAQAAGARYRGRFVGSIGDVGCFSFYPTKNLGAIGDGGMVITNRKDLAERVRCLRQYGWDASRHADDVGLNSRLDPLHAAILGVKLPHLDAENACRAEIAARYSIGLAGLPLILPAAYPGTSHAFHLYVVRCATRDRLMEHLAADKIGSAVHYPVPGHRERGYAARVIVPPGGLPVTEAIVGQILSLPMFPELSDEDADCVTRSIRRFFQKTDGRSRPSSK